MSANTQLNVDQFDLPHPAGGEFRIRVARPAGLAEGARVPILFVADSDLFFGLAAEIARLKAVGGQALNALVVGVGYDAEFAVMAKLRTADLTPPLSEAGRATIGRMSQLIGDQNGGAAAFLTFLTDVLKPEILNRCAEADGERTILFGHSLGGLFAAFALLTRPDAFSVFLSSSPSLWWDGFAVLSHFEGFTERLQALPAQPRVLVDVGAREQDLPTQVPPMIEMSLAEIQAMVTQARMVDAAAEFAAELRARGLDQVGHVSFQDEDHSSVVPAALMRGLTFALDGWK